MSLLLLLYVAKSTWRHKIHGGIRGMNHGGIKGMFATFKVLKNSDIKPLPDKEVKTMEVSKETLYPILYIHEKN